MLNVFLFIKLVPKNKVKNVKEREILEALKYATDPKWSDGSGRQRGEIEDGQVT